MQAHDQESAAPASYVCEQSERHIEPRLKRQRDTAGQSEQLDQNTTVPTAK